MNSLVASSVLGFEPRTVNCNCGDFPSGTMYQRHFEQAQGLLAWARHCPTGDHDEYTRPDDAAMIGLARAVLAYGSYSRTQVDGLCDDVEELWGDDAPDWGVMSAEERKAAGFWTLMNRVEPAVHRGTLVTGARLAGYLVVERLDGHLGQDAAVRCVQRIRVAPARRIDTLVGLELRRTASRDVRGVLELGRAATIPSGGSPAAVFGALVRMAASNPAGGENTERMMIGRARERVLADLPQLSTA